MSLFVLPLVGFIILLLDVYAIYVGFHSTTEPMLKFPVLVLLIIVIPYFLYPFFEPITNKLNNKFKEKYTQENN